MREATLLETIESGFHALTERWQRQLAEGALGAVIPKGKKSYDLIFRGFTESIDQFHDRAARNRAVAVLTVDWRAQIKEFRKMCDDLDALRAEIATKDAALAQRDEALAEAEAEFEGAMDLAVATMARDPDFALPSDPESEQRAARILSLAHARILTDKLNALLDRMTALEAAYPVPSPPPTHESDNDGERSDAP
jgi:hypothetical protein